MTGWKFYEIVGETIINPICYVHEAIRINKDRGNVSSGNVKELIKLCFGYVPHRKAKVLDMIEKGFPEHKDTVNKYRILL